MAFDVLSRRDLSIDTSSLDGYTFAFRREKLAAKVRPKLVLYGYSTPPFFFLFFFLSSLAVSTTRGSFYCFALNSTQVPSRLPPGLGLAYMR